MATLLDTSALVVLIRSRRPPNLEALANVTRDEVAAGRALISVVTVTELLVGARDPRGARALEELVASVPVVAADREVAVLAGRLGASMTITTRTSIRVKPKRWPLMSGVRRRARSHRLIIFQAYL